MATVPKPREPREIDYPTGDGKPLAETPIHRDNLVGLIEVLRLHFQGDPNVYISGNMFLYYVEGDKRRHVSPDVFVVKGIDGANNRDAYFTWVEGKGPDVVFEFTSPSTKKEDLVTKFNLYRDVLHVAEYFLFDPKAEYLKPSMRGYRLNHENEYEPIEPVNNRLPSQVLDLHLERNGVVLRLFDPAHAVRRLVRESTIRNFTSHPRPIAEVRKPLASSPRPNAIASARNWTRSETNSRKRVRTAPDDMIARFFKKRSQAIEYSPIAIDAAAHSTFLEPFVMATVSRTRSSSRVGEQPLVLEGIRWTTYESLLADVGERPGLRLTYDRGTLEIMMLSAAHEWRKKLIGRMIDTLTEELNLPIRSGGSPTFKRALLKRSLEPSDCYWIAGEPSVRGKEEIDLETDPSPDLAVEIEVSRRVVDRLGIYAALGVIELWCFDGRAVRFLSLQADGTYRRIDRSVSFPASRAADATRFLKQAASMDETRWIRTFRAWVRVEIVNDRREP